MEWFDMANHWLWWLIAITLLIFELLLPGVFFLWSALAATVMGLLVWIAPDMSWALQLFIFSLLSIVSVFTANKFMLKKPIETDEPLLNMRGEQYIGRLFTLSQAIENEYGKITVDDTQWRIKGQDCVSGAKVKVTGIDGTTLIVEPANA